MSKNLRMALVVLAIATIGHSYSQPQEISEFIGWAGKNSLILNAKSATKACKTLEVVFKNAIAPIGFSGKNTRYIAIEIGDGNAMASAMIKYLGNGGLPIYDTSMTGDFVMFMFSDKEPTKIAMLVFTLTARSANAFGISVGDGCLFWSEKK